MANYKNYAQHMDRMEEQRRLMELVERQVSVGEFWSVDSVRDAGYTDECGICFRESFTHDSEMHLKLPCKHIFGSCCNNKWLQKKPLNKLSCPFCKEVVSEIVTVSDRKITRIEFAPRQEDDY